MVEPAIARSKLVGLFKQAVDNPYYELEAKLGFFSNGQIKTGVRQEQFDKLFDWLSSSTCFRQVNHHEYCDYSFKNNIRGSGALFDDRIGFITKRSLAHLDFNTGKNSQLGVRFSLKSEVPTELGIGRDIGTYKTVRFKQRSSFLYKHFSFDLTRVWTGANPISALCVKPPTDLLNFKLPIIRDRPPDSFEIELEFLSSYWKDNTSEPFEHLVDSMINRVTEILSKFRDNSDPLILVKELTFDIQNVEKTNN